MKITNNIINWSIKTYKDWLWFGWNDHLFSLLLSKLCFRSSKFRTIISETSFSL